MNVTKSKSKSRKNKSLGINKLKLGQFAQINIWKNVKIQIVLIIVLYALIEIFYHLLFPAFENNATNYYKNAAWVVGTLVVWPFIVIANANKFREIYENFKDIFQPEKGEKWYESNKKAMFSYIPSPKAFNWIIAIAHLSAYIAIPFMHCIVEETIYSEQCILIPLIISAAILLFSKTDKNIHTILFVCTAGMSYYLFLTCFSASSIPLLFCKENIWQMLLMYGLITILFFVAGITIYPIIRFFIAFYHSSFETMLDRGKSNIFQILDRLLEVKRFFIRLAFICVIAYFQLFFTVSFAGIFEKSSAVTEGLFFLGSFFPLIMFLASSYFFDKLCLKITTVYSEDIEAEIHTYCIGKSAKNSDRIQTLVETKEAIETHLARVTQTNLGVLASTLVTVLTTILDFTGKL